MFVETSRLVNKLLPQAKKSIAGLLAKQNIMALNKGENQRDMVMCGVYDNSNDNNQAPQQGQQQGQQGGFSKQGQQQGGYKQR